MKQYIQCPDTLPPIDTPNIFLAGGISNCPDWQTTLKDMIIDKIQWLIVNPRRNNFNNSDPQESIEQIHWEHSHLAKATMISFWFPKETLCPITLYELGRWITSDKDIIIGVHPEYQRKLDIETQTKLVNPNIDIVYSLRDLANTIIKKAVGGPTARTNLS